DDIGAPGKPLDLKMKADPNTGIVTVFSPQDIADVYDAPVYNAKTGAYVDGESYYIVQPDGQTAVNAQGQSINLENAPWQVQQGQVIDPISKLPVVSDMDLAGIIDPTNPGQNLVLAAQDGSTLANWTNPNVQRISDLINAQLDQPRVLHGALDGSSYSLDQGNSAVVFYPDGSTLQLVGSDNL